MTRGLVALCAVVAAVVGVASVHAQPQFHTTTNYVNVDCIVTDGDDKPITDLTKADFEIVERGKAQTIADFKYVSIPIAHRTIDLGQPTPPEPDVATNAPPKPDSRLFVMVVDDLHILEAETVRVQRVMTDFLRALSPDDEVAIVFVGRSDLSQDFTTDVGRLLRTVSHVKDAFGFGLDPLQQLSGLQQAVRAGQASPAGASIPRGLSYARSAGWELKNVAAALATSGHPRRAIVFVSGGVSLDPHAPLGSNGVTASTYVTGIERMAADTVYLELQDAYAVARRSDVPVYTLDPRGGVSAANAFRGFVPDSVENWRLIHTQQDYLATIAINTGGRAIFNRNDLTGAVNDIVAENGSFYLLGYYPDPDVHDGAFHEFSVKVHRPGAHVRARTGYVAPAATASTAATAKSSLDSAMSAGLNVSGIPLRAFAAPLRATTKGVTTLVTVEVDYPTPSDGSRKIDDDLDAAVFALDPDGSIKASSARSLHFSASPRSSMTSAQFLIDQAIDLPSKPLTLRIGVSSRLLGKAGTTQIAIDAPHASSDTLQFGGVVVGLSNDNEPALSSDVLKGLVPFQPTAGRTFAQTDSLRVFGRVLWGKDAAADVTLTIAGSTTAPQTIHLTPASGSGDHHEAMLDTVVPLTGLAAGSYVLHLDARVPGGQPAAHDIVFTVK